MRIIRDTYINKTPDLKGARRVAWWAPLTGWKVVGRLMPEVKNHVQEQPTNRWKQHLIDRAAACRKDAGYTPKGWSHAEPGQVYSEEEARRMYDGVRRSAEYMRKTQDQPNFDGPGDDDE